MPMKISPGDRVVITCDVVDGYMLCWLELVRISKGSILKAVTIDESIEMLSKKYPSEPENYEKLKQKMIDEESIPFVIESVETCDGICVANIGDSIVFQPEEVCKEWDVANGEPYILKSDWYQII
jgi:hypothetical protein